jgi:hypothetical protein
VLTIPVQQPPWRQRLRIAWALLHDAGIVPLEAAPDEVELADVRTRLLGSITSSMAHPKANSPHSSSNPTPMQITNLAPRPELSRGCVA